MNEDIIFRLKSLAEDVLRSQGQSREPKLAYLLGFIEGLKEPETRPVNEVHN